MISWSELDGSDPVTGDVGAVERVAAEFGQTAGAAEDLTRRLRTVGDGSGSAIWRGEAAEVFRRLLAETEPDLVKLATNHDAAEGALRRYAVSLEDAQEQAARALANGTQATADEDAATQQRNQARTDAESAGGTARAADVQLLAARAQSAVAVDPGYQAQLLQYEARVGVQRDQARAQEADGRRRQSAAQSNLDDARGRLEAAKRLAHQAAQVRDNAARTASRELDDAGRPAIDRRNVVQRLWQGAKDTVRDITASPEFASWMNVISDVGDILSTAALVLAFVPGLQPIAGALLISAAALKGIAFAGTLLAYFNGHGSKSQVFGRGLDFGLSLLPMGKAVKLMSKAKELRPITAAGQIKRALNYDDMRKTTGYLRTVRGAPKLGGKELEYVTKVGKKVSSVTPKTYFQVKTGLTVTKDVVKGSRGLFTGGQQLAKDITGHRDPVEQDTYEDKAPEAAKESVSEGIKMIGEATKKEGAAAVASKVAGTVAEKGMERLVR